MYTAWKLEFQKLERRNDYLRKCFTADSAREPKHTVAILENFFKTKKKQVESLRFLARVPPGVKHQTCLVREFGIAVRALVSFLLVVHGVVIVKIGSGFERGATHVTDERPVLRMD